MTIKLIYKVLLCKVYCGCVFWLVHNTVHGPAKCKLQVNCKFEQQKIFCYIIFSNKFSVFNQINDIQPHPKSLHDEKVRTSVHPLM